MSFYRTLLAAIAAIVITSPTFAENANPVSSEGITATQLATNNETGNNGTTSDQVAPSEEKININKATPKDLMKVKGVNASKARALIACRNKQEGQVFKSLDDIAKCKKPKLKPDALKAITDQLTVD